MSSPHSAHGYCSLVLTLYLSRVDMHRRAGVRVAGTVSQRLRPLLLLMWLVAAMAPTGFGRLVAVGVLPGHLTAMLQGTGLNRHTCVFGIDITSTTAVEPDKHILVAAALAELLDNDGDGVVDSPPVVQAMVAARVLVAIYGSNKERRRASMSGKKSLPVTELLRTP